MVVSWSWCSSTVLQQFLQCFGIVERAHKEIAWQMATGRQMHKDCSNMCPRCSERWQPVHTTTPTTVLPPQQQRSPERLHC